MLGKLPEHLFEKMQKNTSFWEISCRQDTCRDSPSKQDQSNNFRFCDAWAVQFLAPRSRANQEQIRVWNMSTPWFFFKYIYNCNIIDIIINIINYMICNITDHHGIYIQNTCELVPWHALSVLFRISQKSVAFLATGV